MISDNMTEAEKLIQLCLSANRVYIYGAGTYAKCIFYILKDNSIDIYGFITSSEEGKKYLEKPLISANRYKKMQREGDLIVPGFNGCSKELIMQALHSLSVLPEIAPMVPKKIMEDYIHHISNEMHDYLKNNYPINALKDGKTDKVLIVRIDAIGDLVCTTALIREVRQNYPKSNITVLVSSANKAIVEDCPYIDKVIECPPNRFGEDVIDDIRGYRDILDLVNSKAQEENICNSYDVAILPNPILEGRRAVESLFYVVKSGASKRIGYCYGPDPLRHEIYKKFKDIFSDLQFVDRPMHETEFQLEMLRKAGMKIKSTKNEIRVNSYDLNTAEDIFLKNGIQALDIVVGIGIVGSKENRNWSRENYRKLTSLISSEHKNIKWLILGGKDAISAAEELSDIDNVIDLTGKLNLNETIACIKKSDIYIGANTGLMHIAATFRKPCIIIYSALSDVSPWDGNGPVRFGAKDTVHVDMIPEAGLDGCHGCCKHNKPHCINLIKPLNVEKELMVFFSNIDKMK